MRTIRINVTTDGSGDATAYGDLGAMGGGLVYAVQTIDGDLADGVDLTLTAETGDMSIPVLVKADFNTDGIYYPRVLIHLNTDGTNITGQYTYPLAVGRFKAVIAQGGATKTGAILVYMVES
jgi:hypothetical protein